MFNSELHNNNNPTKDHLGSIRVVTDQAMNIEQVNDYTPFGVSMKNNYSDTSGQKYKYNGKEFDRMHGLDWYDYGARWMDASIGRWHSVDPLCEKYYSVSPYVYCLDNPIMYIDKKGEKPGDFFKTMNAAAIDFGMYYNGNSIRMNKEFGANIIHIKDSEGNSGFTYTMANKGDSGNVGIPCPPPGAKLAATIHTHAAYLNDEDAMNNDFSGMKDAKDNTNAEIRLKSKKYDIGNANERGIPSYVATPCGSLKRYDPSNGKITIVSNSLPSDEKDPDRMNNIEAKENIKETLVDLLKMESNINIGITNELIK